MKTENATIIDGIPELGISVSQNDSWVSSRTLASIFEKRHDHVLRDIEDSRKKLTPQFWVVNFKSKTYTLRGKKYPEYLLNRKSFSIIAMGYTGKKAMEFKEKYIEAFEGMYELIKTRLISKGGYREMTMAIKQNQSNSGQYWEEANMINVAVLGMTAKNFQDLNKIENGKTRDGLVSEKLNNLDIAQRMNARLIKAGRSLDDRKSIINDMYKN
jgi:Rha family phage regulatory protein